MDNSSLHWAIEYLWVPLWVAVGALFKMLFNFNKRVTHLEADSHSEETTKMIQHHHETVMASLKGIEQMVQSHGRRLGVVEANLMNRKD